MNKLSRYVLVAAVMALVAFLAWYFSSVLVYIVISVVISLLGKPLVRYLRQLKFGRFVVPAPLAGFVALIAILGILIGFFVFLTPMVVSLFQQIHGLNLDSLVHETTGPLGELDATLKALIPSLPEDFSVVSSVMGTIRESVSFSMLSGVLGGAASFLMDFAIGLFSVIFISYFFLLDENTFARMLQALVPDKYEQNISRALDSINNLLVRYFLGISLETILITVLNTAGLYYIAGLDFSMSVVLAFISGVVNVIPYVGPLTGGAFGTVIGFVSQYNQLTDTSMGLYFLTLVAIFVVTHLVDVFVFQPYIYANSVKAHPLEIFIVILLAANIGGILGMLVAIPSYTVLRVFAAEFLSQFKLVQRLTDHIKKEEAES